MSERPLHMQEPTPPTHPLLTKPFRQAPAGLALSAERVKRYAMVIDTRLCDGCQTCSVTCKTDNQVPLGETRCRVEYASNSGHGDSRRAFLPRMCNQCDNPPCVAVCRSGATYRRQQDGIVAIDQQRCTGCGKCLAACPYGMRFINHQTSTADKCDFCLPRLKKGHRPSCVSSCRGRARTFGDINDPKSRISQILATHHTSVLQPELGTQPMVFYIDPLGKTQAVEQTFPSLSSVNGPMSGPLSHYYGTQSVPAYPMIEPGTARERAAVYHLMATLFRDYPDRFTLLTLRAPNFRKTLAMAGMHLDDRFLTRDLESLTKELNTAFKALFKHPDFMLIPFEASQRDDTEGLSPAATSRQLYEYYRAAEFDIHRYMPLQPDHVSTELEFMAHLASREAEAWEQGDMVLVGEALQIQNEFLEKHPGQWVCDFARRVQHRNEHPFYNELARLTEAWLEEQLQLVPLLIRQAAQIQGTP